MKNQIEVTGDFDLKIFDKAGEMLEHFSAKNLVVDLGKSNVSKLIAGDPAGAAITQIACGAGQGTPDVSDTTLSNMFVKPVASVSYPDHNSTTFHWTIEDTEANGIDITEFGLFTASNNLFARKVRSAITKTNAIRLQGSWTIHIN